MSENWFPTADRLLGRYHRWRMSPWWPSESRGCRQRSLLRLLAVAHEQRLDIAPLLRNHAGEQFGIHRMRVNRLAGRVEDGTPIIEALEQTPEVLGDDIVLAIRFGAQTGTLSRTYEELIASHNADGDLPELTLQHTAIYTIVSLAVLGLVLSFLAIFIFPTLIEIENEFGLSRMGTGAPMFSLLVAICDHFVNAAPLYILVVLTLACLIWLSPSRRLIRRILIPKWFDQLSQSHVAEVLRLLALAIDAGRPVPSAISTLAHYHFDSRVRHQLLHARNDVEQGADPWSSLAKVKLLTEAESTALSQSTSDTSRVWAMRRLAAWKRSGVLNQRDRTASLVQPAVTLVMAAIVLLISSAMIGFLAHMIWYLA